MNSVGGHPRGASLLMLMNASCHKKHEYIWFMGGDLNGFQGRVRGGGMHGHNREGGTSPSVLLNGSYHKKGEYIWLRGVDLNGYRDIKTFVIRTWRGMPVHARKGFPIFVIKCVLT